MGYHLVVILGPPSIDFGIISDSSGSHFGVIWQSFWNHLAVILRSPGTHFGTIWQSFLGSSGNHFGIIWQSVWDHLAVILGPSGSHFGTIWQSFWDHLAVILGSFGTHFGILWQSFWDHLAFILGSSGSYFGIITAPNCFLRHEDKIFIDCFELRFDMVPVACAGCNKTAKALNPEFNKLRNGMRRFICEKLVIIDASTERPAPEAKTYTDNLLETYLPGHLNYRRRWIYRHLFNGDTRKSDIVEHDEDGCCQWNWRITAAKLLHWGVNVLLPQKVYY